MLAQHDIKRELVVKLERNIVAESLSYLNQRQMNHLTQSSNAQNSQRSQIPQRRASIASTSLFAINNTVREAGFDHFRKIPRSNQIQTSGTCGTSSVQPGQQGFDINKGASTSGTIGVNVDNLNNASHGMGSAYNEYDEVEYLQYSSDSEVDQAETLITSPTVETVSVFPTIGSDDDDFGIAHLFEQIPVNNDEIAEDEHAQYVYFDEFGSSDFYEEYVSTHEGN